MIGPKKTPKIYSLYEITAILFYATCIMFLPIVLVVTYVLDIDTRLDINRFILIVLIVEFVLMSLGTAVLAWRKDTLKRHVKPVYFGEYLYLLGLSIFGILGFVVFYDYLGGDRQYIANILVLIAAALIYALINLGRRYFKFDYMKKK